MLKSAAGEHPLGLPVGQRAGARAGLERVCRGPGWLLCPHADEERDAARFESAVGRSRPEQCATERTELGRRRGGEAAAVKGCDSTSWARSVLGLPGEFQQPAAAFRTEPAAEGAGWIARYAWTGRMETGKVDASGTRRPSDYHKVLLKRMKMLELRLAERFGSFEARCFVDTGPVWSGRWATAAGVGWTGKNTCLIHPKLGSFGFLGGSGDFAGSEY